MQPTVFVRTGNDRRPVTLEDTKLSQGGVGAVYRTLDMPGALLKVYHRNSNISQFDRTKIEAMLDRPPANLDARVNGQRLPQFAWPSHLLEDAQGNGIGFVMPEARNITRFSALLMRSELDLQHISLNDRSLPTRLALARNLAGMVASLHEQQHFIVDLKPENIVVFRDTGVLCMVDCDGMHITGRNGHRFPATAFTSGYLMPEVLHTNQAPDTISNDHQDRFALAVILFKLCQQYTDLHPYQGIRQFQADDNTLDFNVRNNLYAYSIQENPRIKPSPASTHDCWDTATRKMFDRAFMAPRPEDRPSASEWRSHFHSIIESQTALQRCTQHPNEVTHIHFRGKPCPECRIGSSALRIIPVPLKQLHSSGNLLPPPNPSNLKWLWLIIALAVIGFLLLLAAD